MVPFINLQEAMGALLTENVYDPGRLDAIGRPIRIAKIGDKITREMVAVCEQAGLELLPTDKGILLLNVLRLEEEENLGVSSMQVRKAPQGLWPSQMLVINGKVKEVRYTRLGGSKGHILDTWWKSFSELGGTGFVGRYI